MKEIYQEKIEQFKQKAKKITQLFLCKAKKFFSIRVFSKGQMLIFCIIIIYGTFLYQTILQFAVFIIGTLIGWFTGYMGIKHVKKILEKAERAIENPFIPIDKKYVEAVDAVHTSCDYLGIVMDRYNLKQGTAPYLKELKQKTEVKD